MEKPKVTDYRKYLKMVFRRRFMIALMLLSQVLFMVLLVRRASRFNILINGALHVISFLVCLDIVGKKEKGGYKLTWIFLILIFPIFGGLFYVLFYLQSNPKKYRRYFDGHDRACRPLALLPGSALESLRGAPCLSQIRYLQEYAGFPVYSRTRTEYLPSGEAFYKKALEKLQTAERYIFLEFFILRPGLMLDSILALLEKKAREGLDVRLLYDDIGCFLSLPAQFRDYLKERGIKCEVFNPFTPLFSSLQNNRDHRKIIIIDGKIAFTGGVNLADEYINAIEKYGHWKDAAIMVEGEAAWSLTLIFFQLWNMGKHKVEDYSAFYPGQAAVGSDGFVQPYADSPMDEENVGEHVFIKIINNAKEFVFINTPYLIVDDNILSALTLAAKSGVDVRIITPYRADKKWVHITTQSYYRQLVKAGVKVYEYSDGFNHSKTFVSDDRVAAVGTTNLDFRSLYLHFECGVCLYENSSIAGIKDDFLNTLPVCRAITLADCSPRFGKRLFQDLLRLFAPLM
jgi:cardiolipin synthase